MKAARYYGPGNVKIEEIPEPEPSEGQIKVKIAWFVAWQTHLYRKSKLNPFVYLIPIHFSRNGICGSDLHAYLAQVPKYATDDEPNEITGEMLPVTIGHEFSGTIVGHGSGVDYDKWKSGQNVVVEPVISCLKGSCTFCVSGTRNLCPSVNFIGIGGWGGGLAEYIAVDTRYVHLLPEVVSLEVGAMIEPLAVAWYAVKRSGYKRGQTALIAGGGPIGLLILKVLRSIDSSSTVVVSEVASGRRSFASELGATFVVDPLIPSPDGYPSPATVSKRTLDITNGLGVDVGFDAAGVQASLEAVLLSLRPRGTFVNVAVWEETSKVDMNYVVSREINMTGSMAYCGIHSELIEAVAMGKIPNLEDLITKKIALEDLVEEGIQVLLTEKDNHGEPVGYLS